MRTAKTTAVARPKAPAADPFKSPSYGSRMTRPDYFNAFAGGMGIIPRRGWDERTTRFLRESADNPIRALRQWTTSLPLVILSALIDTHPLAEMALENDLTLAFGPGTTRIVAVENENDKNTNAEGTAVIEDLWRSLPPDVGGLTGLQWTLAEQVNKTGMWAIEGVPGEGPGTGLIDAPDFSPLSLRFRDTVDGRILEQEQIGPNATTDLNTTLPGWQPLDPTYCLTASWRGSRNNPYGAPRYGAFLGEGLADVSEERDKGDWFHTVAWPRLSVTFPYDKVVEYARNNPEILQGKGPDGRDLTESEYAAIQFNAFATKLADLKSDDVMMLPMGAEAKALSLAATGLTDISDRRRLRVIQSLKQLPNLMGVTDGGTQAYAVEQSRVHYNKLGAFRAFVNRGPVALANLHLRLLGIPLIARADTDPIAPRDRVQEANAKKQEIENGRELLDDGLISPEEYSQDLVGSSPFDLARLKARMETRAASQAAPAKPAADPNPTGDNDPDYQG